MDRVLYIVGTNHQYQLDFHSNPKSGQHTATENSTFFRMLNELAASVGADIIAEELSKQVLQETKINASIPQLVADNINIAHLFCDPDSSERHLLGIKENNSIIVDAFFQNMGDADIQCAISENRLKREREWLRRLKQIEFKRGIFICGAHHANSIMNLALADKINALLIHDDWQI
jgi:hypothetical protein